MPDFIVAFTDTDHFSETVSADYYKHDEGWITFKDSDHKVVADIPEHVVKMISRSDTATGTAIDLLKERIRRNKHVKARLVEVPASISDGVAEQLDAWIAADEALITALT